MVEAEPEIILPDIPEEEKAMYDLEKTLESIDDNETVVEDEVNIENEEVTCS